MRLQLVLFSSCLLLRGAVAQSTEKWGNFACGVVVAKRRIVVTLLDVSPVFVSQKCQQSRGSGGVVVAKRQNSRHFWPCFWREERREERGEKIYIYERREERREKRGGEARVEGR